MRILLLVLCLLMFGCTVGKRYEHGTLTCGNCRRVIYDGDIEIHSNGFRWPVGSINHCPAWDINCVSEFRDDTPHKSYWGYDAGRKDALEFRYHKEFDPKIHHPAYVEGYKKGYKEVIDVRREGTKGEDNEPQLRKD